MVHHLKDPTPKTIRRDRRRFLRMAGAGVAGAGLFMIGCDDDETQPDGPVDLGSGDVGILNYAYALEQLEAAFYAAVLAGGYYAAASADEKQVLADLEKHERAHVDFFRTAINSVATAIPDLEVDFSSIDFNDRTSVLSTAKTFEDLGVSAYNGAGRLIQDANYLLVAGKIVSVEARHAAAIRDLIDSDPTSFAGDDLIDANGLEMVRTPAQVLSAAGSFIRTEIDASNLPG